MKSFILLGSINMALVVALGAFGAHGLEGKISERMLQNWQTATHYHMAHALGLLLVGLLAAKLEANTSLLQIGGWLLFAGIVLFSGSLYVMALTNITKLGIITPFGGVAFIVGWILVAVATFKYITS
ncbi:DUF423 domain-containing protein [Thermoflavimicrobium dichotomicum]|uniref:Uncharacterized membrane protein YgdD, TMEM256/DUF423 family n=1 Tax=Thermoflavimicrobium dichotomicum TaxID=46223 RepID=A0A1I3MVB5_9BACL|nr:DUF423 domain-containing protein [Thermoflavimicrobium dichotomicum]SFJ00918.1 Uncharacterized membrane protein YgdD, TMEM256/DUF423 family [Thermoflavimicrobium dichotomicum]